MAAPEHLFTPLRLGPVELRNRIVSTAHQTSLVHDHLPTDDFVAYHEARARGGVGLIVLEATAIHPSALLTSHTLGGYLPELVDGYRRVARAVQPTGTRLFVQLLHGGREQIATAPRAPALAPSAVPSPRFRVEPRAARPAEIDELVRGYARAAELAAEGGLDGIELSAAHRYLIEQFLDPALNRREDFWRDGRRFLVEVIRAVRRAAPGLCLGVRLSADSERAAGVKELLAAEGVDYLSLALGDSSTYLGSVGIVPPPPVGVDAIAEPARRFADGVPRILTSRVVDVEAADRLVAEGRADAVGMTRALIADPELPAKARAGRADVILRCIGCNACIARYRDHALRLDGVEVVQAWDVLEGHVPAAANVVVADWGGDPGGLDAAELLAAAGKSVTLAVASVAVGESVHQYRRNLYLQRLYRAGVTIAPHLELESAADGAVLLRNVFAPELVTTLRAEALVLALGRIPEDELAPLLRAEGLTVEEAGDCLTPRSLEEAVLEGTLAARRVFA